MEYIHILNFAFKLFVFYQLYMNRNIYLVLHSIEFMSIFLTFHSNLNEISRDDNLHILPQPCG